jgi:hypothetical protein
MKRNYRTVCSKVVCTNGMEEQIVFRVKAFTLQEITAILRGIVSKISQLHDDVGAKSATIRSCSEKM